MTTFVDVVQRFLRSRQLPIYVFVTRVKYAEKPSDLSERAESHGFVFTIKNVRDNEFRFVVKLRKRGAEGVMLWFDDGTVMFVVPSPREKEEIVYDVTKRALRRLYPLIVSPIISVKSFFDILDSLAKTYNVIIEWYLLRRRKSHRTTKQWMLDPYEKAKEEIKRDMREKLSALDLVRIRIFDTIEREAILKITRHGTLTIYESSLEMLPVIQENIIRKHIEKHIKDFKNLERVGKKEIVGDEERCVITSMKLKFDNEIDPNDFEKLLNMLRESFYVSIYHLGNPWMHLALVDKGDGSSYDLIVTTREARVIPSVKATPNSLTLVVDTFRALVPEPQVEVNEAALP